MAKVHWRNVNKDETPYVYRLAISCLGKTIEFAVPRDDVAAVRAKGHSLAAGVKGRLTERVIKGRKRQAKAKATTQGLRKTPTKNAKEPAVAVPPVSEA